MTTPLTKCVTRESETLRQGRKVLVTLCPNDTITLRQKGLRRGFTLTVGQAFDLAVKYVAAERLSLKTRISKAKKAKDFARVLELQDQLKRLDKGE
jgi:hypothetical protein